MQTEFWWHTSITLSSLIVGREIWLPNLRCQGMTCLDPPGHHPQITHTAALVAISPYQNVGVRYAAHQIKYSAPRKLRNNNIQRLLYTITTGKCAYSECRLPLTMQIHMDFSNVGTQDAWSWVCLHVRFQSKGGLYKLRFINYTLTCPESYVIF